MIRAPPRSTLDRSSAASDVYKRQPFANALFVATRVSFNDVILINAAVAIFVIAVDRFLLARYGTSQIVHYEKIDLIQACLLYTSPSPRDRTRSRMPSSA